MSTNASAHPRGRRSRTANSPSAERPPAYSAGGAAGRGGRGGGQRDSDAAMMLLAHTPSPPGSPDSGAASPPHRAHNASAATSASPRRLLQTNPRLPRSPHRSPSKTSPQADRFIPDRSLMDAGASHFRLVQEMQQGAGDDAAPISPSQLDFQRSMQSNLLGTPHPSKARILALRQKPPPPPPGLQSHLKVLYTHQALRGKLRRATRHIPQTPDRILDAPELRADFYLNLIDWSARNIIAVALSETVYLWNATNGNICELCKTEDAEDYVASISWTDSGSHVAIGTNGAQVQIWDVERKKKLRTLTDFRGRVASLSWNQHLLTGGSKVGEILSYDVRAPTPASRFNGHTQEVCGLKWSGDGKHLASGGNDNLVNIWSARGRKLHCFTDHKAAVKAIAWCPWQSNLLVTGGGTQDRHLRFWNTTNGACLNSVDTKSQICGVLWSAEHRELASGHGYSQNQLTLWKYPTLSKVTELNGHTQRVLAMAMSPDGSTIVSAAGDETLRFWKCFASDESTKKLKRRTSAAGRLTASIR